MMSVTLLLAACGDSGATPGTDSASGSSSGTGGTTAMASEVTDSVPTMAATDITVGSESATGVPTTTTDPTTTDPTAEPTTDPTTTTTDTTGEPQTSSTSTGEPLPESCAAPPPGYDGNTDPACELPPVVGTFMPVVEWSKTSWEISSNHKNIMSTPIVASLTDDNGDGKIDDKDSPDLIVATWAGGSGWSEPGVVRAMHGKDGKDIFTIPATEKVFGSTGLAAGDIDGDGMVEIVVHALDGGVRAYEHTGAFKWKSVPLVHAGFPEAGYPAIADMDGDGSPEIILGNYILNSDGTLRGTGKHGNGFKLSFAADIDQDGDQELVVGNALYDANGKDIWFNGQKDGMPAIADINQDGKLDIVVTSGYSENTVRLQNGADGSVVWTTVLPSMGGGPPTIADFDGDGEPEIGVASGSHYVVIEGDGKIKWQQATIDSSSRMTGSSVFDFEGDGAAEVIYNDEKNLRVYAGTDGMVKLTRFNTSATLWEYPLAVDIDDDGQAEIISFANGINSGVTILGDMNKSWKPARKIWNQHAYSITNVNDDGTIPATPAPNFKQYNNFRSADLAPPDGTDLMDLRLDVLAPCVIECVDGKLIVQVHVGNEGLSPLVSPATLEVVGLLAGQPVTTLMQEVPAPLPAGMYTAAFSFELPAVGIDAVKVTVSSVEEECNTMNNTITLDGAVCQ